MEIFHTGINRRQGKLQYYSITTLEGKYDNYGHQEELFLQPNWYNQAENVYFICYSLYKPPLVPPSTNTTCRLVKFSLQMWSSKFNKKIIRYKYLKLFLNLLKWMNWKKPRAHMKKVKWMKVQRWFQWISRNLRSLSILEQK